MTLEIRPLSASITEIPEIHFSFFEPVTKRYKVLKSKPIAIKVLAIPSQEKKPLPVATPPTIQKPKAKSKLAIADTRPLVPIYAAQELELDENLVKSWGKTLFKNRDLLFYWSILLVLMAYILATCIKKGLFKSKQLEPSRKEILALMAKANEQQTSMENYYKTMKYLLYRLCELERGSSQNDDFDTWIQADPIVLDFWQTLQKGRYASSGNSGLVVCHKLGRKVYKHLIGKV